MQTRTKISLMTLVVGLIAFPLGPNGPLGQLIWPEMAGDMTITGIQIGLFIFYNAIVAFALGFGISYWAFGFKWTRSLFPKLTTAAHIALGYIPMSFWLHDSLHMVNGENVAGLIAIEYLFHVPMIGVGVLLIAATIKSVVARSNGPAFAASG